MYNIFDSKTANNRAVMDPQLTLHPTRTTGEAPGHPCDAWSRALPSKYPYIPKRVNQPNVMSHRAD